MLSRVLQRASIIPRANPALMSSLMGMQNRCFATAVGQKIPSALVSVVKFDSAENKFVNEIVNTSEYFAGKRVAFVGYPGAYTPTCMATHIPEYISSAE